ERQTDEHASCAIGDRIHRAGRGAGVTLSRRSSRGWCTCLDNDPAEPSLVGPAAHTVHKALVAVIRLVRVRVPRPVPARKINVEEHQRAPVPAPSITGAVVTEIAWIARIRLHRSGTDRTALTGLHRRSIQHASITGEHGLHPRLV